MSDELLLQILACLERIEQAGSRRPPRPLSGKDRRRLTRLLPAVGGAYGSEPFMVRDLVEDGLPGLRVVLEGLSVKAVGQLFAKAEGIDLRGYMVARAEPAAGVNQWTVKRVVEACGTGQRSAKVRTIGSEA